MQTTPFLSRSPRRNRPVHPIPTPSFSHVPFPVPFHLVGSREIESSRRSRQTDSIPLPIPSHPISRPRAGLRVLKNPLITSCVIPTSRQSPTHPSPPAARAREKKAQKKKKGKKGEVRREKKKEKIFSRSLTIEKSVHF